MCLNNHIAFEKEGVSYVEQKEKGCGKFSTVEDGLLLCLKICNAIKLLKSYRVTVR